MQITLSSKGQIVLPAAMRRFLGLKARAKLEIEERDGGLFIRPVRKKSAVEPIKYLPLGSIKLSDESYDFDRLTSDDDVPHS